MCIATSLDTLGNTGINNIIINKSVEIGVDLPASCYRFLFVVIYSVTHRNSEWRVACIQRCLKSSEQSRGLVLWFIFVLDHKSEVNQSVKGYVQHPRVCFRVLLHPMYSGALIKTFIKLSKHQFRTFLIGPFQRVLNISYVNRRVFTSPRELGFTYSRIVEQGSIYGYQIF